ncbi:flagellar basal body P-ring formation chaperone FlgA [Salinisphaera sp. T31B1]|uniref:flagellar basal body P-ring formation chaperone FlgA n=1 Tax=Salinisphaera sp. T31B1 TaxID=727963 RepID=UPI00333FB6F9
MLATGLMMLAGTVTAAAADVPAPVARAITAFVHERSDYAPDQIQIAIPAQAARMTHCRKPEPFLPGRSQRMTGRLTIGVRCPGDRPSLRYYPVDVAISAPYYVAARTINPGEVVRAADVHAVTGEITRLADNIATRADQLVGQVAMRRIAADMPVRLSMVAPPKAIERGARVRVIRRGSGFAITTEGQALDSATAGASLRVRTDNGSVVRGVADGPNQVVVGG